MKKFIGIESALLLFVVFALLALGGLHVSPVVWAVFAVALASGIAVDVVRFKYANQR